MGKVEEKTVIRGVGESSRGDGGEGCKAEKAIGEGQGETGTAGGGWKKKPTEFRWMARERGWKTCGKKKVVRARKELGYAKRGRRERRGW